MGARLLRVAVASVVAALALVAGASSRPTAGISVSPMPPTVALLQSDPSSGVYTYGIAMAARWQPEALHSEVRGSIAGSELGTRYVNVVDQGNNLHSSATYRSFFAAYGGERLFITARWHVYTPQPSGLVEGTKLSGPTIINVPKPEPRPRLTDQQKMRLQALAKGHYAACASALIGGLVSVATGIGAPVGIALGVLAGIHCMKAFLDDQMARDPVDLGFRVVAKPKTPAVPTVTAGKGLTAAGAAAVNRLVAVMAKEIGLARAIVTAFNRSQGAHVKKQTSWERKQMLAAGRYAGQLSALISSEAKLRSSIAHALAPVDVSFDDAYANGSSIAVKGLPKSFAAGLARLGVTKVDQKEIRAQLAVIDPQLYDGDAFASIAAPLLLYQLREAAAELKAFSKKAAKDPLGTRPP
jgi:hypothetical protein